MKPAPVRRLWDVARVVAWHLTRALMLLGISSPYLVVPITSTELLYQDVPFRRPPRRSRDPWDLALLDLLSGQQPLLAQPGTDSAARASDGRSQP